MSELSHIVFELNTIESKRFRKLTHVVLYTCSHFLYKRIEFVVICIKFQSSELNIKFLILKTENSDYLPAFPSSETEYIYI